MCCSAHTREVDGHSNSIAPSVGGILWCIVVFLLAGHGGYSFGCPILFSPPPPLLMQLSF